MVDGPLSAPFSPPGMPTPKQWIPFSLNAFSRAAVAVRSVVPPSVLVRPASRRLLEPRADARDEPAESAHHGAAGLHRALRRRPLRPLAFRLHARADAVCPGQHHGLRRWRAGAALENGDEFRPADGSAGGQG